MGLCFGHAKCLVTPCWDEFTVSAKSRASQPSHWVGCVAWLPPLRPRSVKAWAAAFSWSIAKGADFTNTLYGFWLALSVLLNTYVLVGVDGWCPKQVADDYLDLVEEKLWHPRSPGLAAVADIELRHRLRWVELTRGPEGLKLGEAIKSSVAELAGAWQYGPETPPATPRTPQGNKRKIADRDKEAGYTIQESKGGTAICHSWNLGKCKDADTCPANRLHICDITGCGKKHRRVEHRRPVQ